MNNINNSSVKNIFYSRENGLFLTMLILFLCISGLNSVYAQTSYTVTTPGMFYAPDTINCNVGDTINFILGPSHNAVEVDQATYNANGFTSNGGFNFGFGTTGSFVVSSAQTHYYVCSPHVTMGMKGVIIANNPNAQNLTVSSLPASSTSANDGQAIAQINIGSGNHTFYWENLSTGNPAFGPTNTTLFTDTFFNAPSGTYVISFIDNTTSTFINDTVTITAPGGSFTYSGSLGLCGTTSTDITVFLNGCTFANPNLGTQYLLTDNNGSTLLNTTILSDSIVLSSLSAGTYVLTALNFDNGCTASDTFSITAGSLNASVISTNVLGTTLGTATITASGGTGPYFICW